MALLLLTSAAILSLASALSSSPLYGCLPLKSGQQINVCPYDVCPFHVLCGPMHFNEASDACMSQGWRLAVVGDENKLEGLMNVRNCTPTGAWVSSFNGVEGSGCFQFKAGLPIIETDLSEEYCKEHEQAALCEDVPVEVITTTSYIATSVVDGIKTKTKEVVPTCPPNRHHQCKPHHQDTEFVILREHLPYAQAECACKQLNLKLADLTILNFLDASHELYSELGPRKHAWIRSWNGDKYDQNTCLALWTGSTGPNGAIAQPRSCEYKSPVVCQRPYRPVCPCIKEQHDCRCLRPVRQHHEHHHHNQTMLLKKAGLPQKQVFIEAKPIFANPQEKSYYEQTLARIKQQQQQQLEKAKTSKKPQTPAKVRDEAGLVDHEREQCIDKRPDCPKVCKYRARGLRVVKANSTAYDANYVCSRFGWSLLDYKSCQEEDVEYLKEKCHGEEKGLWIRSYNGVDGGACMLITGGEGVPVGWVISADDCVALGDKYVLCQTNDHPVNTTSGTYIGSVTYTTTTEDATTTSTNYTATVTTTVTLLF